MELLVKRKEFTENSTIGELYIDNKFFCYTLEDPIREEKIAGKTAIPLGKYEIIIDYSQRFKKELPKLLNVPNFSGVRIHQGNTSKDTEGCILVGLTKDKDFIGNSRYTLSLLLEKLEDSYKKEEKITIEILNG